SSGNAGGGRSGAPGCMVPRICRSVHSHSAASHCGMTVGDSLELEMDGQCASVGWRTLLRGAGLIGMAAVASGVLSALATKIFAAMLGPAELAVLATLQQIRQGGLTVATLNGQTALVRGLSARSGRERREFLRTVLL